MGAGLPRSERCTGADAARPLHRGVVRARRPTPAAVALPSAPGLTLLPASLPSGPSAMDSCSTSWASCSAWRTSSWTHAPPRCAQRRPKAAAPPRLGASWGHTCPYSPPSPQSDKLDLGYHLGDSSLYPREDPRLLPGVSAEEVSEAAAAAAAPASHHFMTRVYFLALRCLHLGLLPCMRELVSINQHANHVRSAAGSLDEPASSPRQRMAQQQFMSLQRRLLVMETQLLDDALLQPLLRLCALTAGLLRRHLGDSMAPRAAHSDTQSSTSAPRSASTHAPCGRASLLGPAHLLHPLRGVCSLPLARPDAPPLLYLPEHVVGDWAEALLFLGQAQTSSFDEADAEGLLDFVVAILASPHLVHSPHLRAKFGEVG